MLMAGPIEPVIAGPNDHGSRLVHAPAREQFHASSNFNCMPVRNVCGSHALHRTEGDVMKRTAIIGTSIYLGFVIVVIGGSYATIQAVLGTNGVQAASADSIEKQGPTVRTSGKWTPVEIKREVAETAPPLPPYVIPARRVDVARHAPKARVVAARAAPTAYRQQAAGYGQQVAAYAAPEPSRMFGPFFFGR
jgi:hypothetical protein